MSSANIFLFIKHSQNRQAKLLSSSILHEIETHVDENNATVLHVAANNNNYEMSQYFLKQHDRLMRQPNSPFTEQSKSKWLSMKDDQGFTCLHYAVFRGNYKIVKLFEQHGSDIYQINNQSLSVLHIAAQGDSPLLLYYFLTKGMKIGMTDSKGNTPLHWACYSGMENSSFALISWGSQIDRKQQHFGMTPLHLAVMSGNSRIVRKLLLKGCDRNIRSFNGKLPLDIARQNQYTNIAQMIIDERGLSEIFNLKSPTRKLSKYNTPFYLFVILFVLTLVMNICSFALCQNQIMHQGFYGTFIGFGAIVGLFFVATLLSNPGRLRQFDRHRGMLQILIKNRGNRICFDCGIVKPQRSRHCQVCQSCISVYDHHCPWVANCVGSYNYCIFYAFLIATFVYLLYTFGFSIANLVHENWGNLKNTDILRIATSAYSLVAASLFAVPLLLLIGVQTRNLMSNVTTFERYSGTMHRNSRRQSTTSSSRKSSRNMTEMSQLLKSDVAEHPSMSMSMSRNSTMRSMTAFTNGYFKNCQAMCWGNKNIVKYKIAI